MRSARPRGHALGRCRSAASALAGIEQVGVELDRHVDVAVRTALAAAWTGKYRYGVSGSLVRFVDRRVGRPGLFAMLGATSDAELLARLGLSEAELLVAWRTETGAPVK